MFMLLTHRPLSPNLPRGSPAPRLPPTPLRDLRPAPASPERIAHPSRRAFFPGGVGVGVGVGVRARVAPAAAAPGLCGSTSRSGASRRPSSSSARPPFASNRDAITRSTSKSAACDEDEAAFWCDECAPATGSDDAAPEPATAPTPPVPPGLTAPLTPRLALKPFKSLPPPPPGLEPPTCASSSPTFSRPRPRASRLVVMFSARISARRSCTRASPSSAGSSNARHSPYPSSSKLPAVKLPVKFPVASVAPGSSNAASNGRERRATAFDGSLPDRSAAASDD